MIADSQDEDSAQSLPILEEIDTICDRFEAELQAGRSPRIEDFVAHASETARQPLEEELLRVEIACRRGLGETLLMGDYEQRFPQHVRLIAQLLDLAPTTQNAANSDTTEEHSEFFSWRPGLQLLEQIGSGGMGKVYKVYQTALDRIVAIKTVRPELLTTGGLEQFQHEARLLAKLCHPNIVQILDYFPNAEVPYFVMEYVDGLPLDQVLRGRPWREQVAIFKDAVAAVASAHDYGVIHGDLKPANILVDRRSRPRILDFGLARLARDASGQKDGSKLHGGTFAFLAPEILAGDARPTPASDIYALGVTLYILLTGIFPFQSRKEVQLGQPRVPLEIDPDIPEALQRICLNAMERFPADRYATAEQLLHDLQRYLEGRPVFARPTLYARLLQGRMHNHKTEIQMWYKDGLVSQREADALLRPYRRIFETESPWLSETRRILTGPLMLRLGAWLLLVSTILWPIYYWNRIGKSARLASSGIPALLMAGLGVGFLYLRKRSSALACFGSFSLLLLVFVVVLLSESRWFEVPQAADWELWGDRVYRARGNEGRAVGGDFLDEFVLCNYQVFCATLIITAVIASLQHYLRTVFFASWLAVAFLGLFSACLLLIGDMKRLGNENVAWVALHYLLVAVGLMLVGWFLDRRQAGRSSWPSYQLGAAVFLAAAIGLARFGAEEWFHKPWKWQEEVWNLWLMCYSIPLFLLGWLAERFGTEGQRVLAWLPYWLVPVFVLVPLNMLFVDQGPIICTLGPNPVRLYEALYLPACLALLILGRSLQIESFLLAGILGLGIFVFRVTGLHFEEKRAWPLTVGILGTVCVAIGVWRSWRTEKPRAT
jgi:predicted Ser/Thr protein kinase